MPTIHLPTFTYSPISVLVRSKDIDNTWYNNPKIKIICCTDGVRPVVFKLEQLLD